MTDFKLGDTLDFKFTTRRFSTGAPFTLAGTPSVAAYPDNSTTEITAGITLTTDFDARTGLNNVRVVATGANGYATGTSYALVITAGTVDSVSVVGEVVAQFTIERSASFQRLGAPAGASVSADVAAVKSDTAAVKTKTDFLPSVVAGGSGGVFIAGANAATSIVNASGDALTLTSNGGNGSGLNASGAGTGNGIRATGGAGGHGIRGIGGSGGGSGIRGEGTGSSTIGIDGVGVTDGAGIQGRGGAIGHGIQAEGGSSSGDGIFAHGNGSGNGIQAVLAGTGTFDINAPLNNLAPQFMVTTTIATLASQTSFTLTDGSPNNDAYNGCVAVIVKAATNFTRAVAVVLDYVGATKTITLLNDPAIFTMAVGDVITIFADRALKPLVDTRTLSVSAAGDLSGSVASVVGAVGSVTGNIGGNVVGSVASVTADVGITQGGADKVWGTAVRTLTGFSFAVDISAAAVQAIWDALTVALTTAGSIGKLLVDRIDAAVSSRATPAQVNAEVVDALAVDTYAEPGQSTPAATASLATKIGFLVKAWRNRSTQTATTYSLYNDDAVTVDQKATVSDDGVTTDRGEVTTGP